LSKAVSKGDEELIELLRELTREIKSYSECFLSLHRNLNEAIIRFDAIVHPTSENKLKALSCRPMDEISNEIKGNIEDAKSNTKSIVSLLKKVEEVVRTSKIECSLCSGKGEVITQSYYREKDVVHSYLESRKCSECNGKGYLEVSATIVQLANQLLDELKELTQKENLNVKIYPRI